MKDEKTTQPAAAAASDLTKDQFAICEGAVFVLDTGASPIIVSPDGTITIRYKLKESADLVLGEKTGVSFPGGKAFGVFKKASKNNYKKGGVSELKIYTTSTEVGVASNTATKEVNIVTDGEKRESGQSFTKTSQSEKKTQ